MDDISCDLLCRIRSKAGKVLYAVAQGHDMTKLDIKKETALSMSTVLSSVEALRRRGLLTLVTQRVKTGGKPHSVINIARDKAIYGVSYKARTLTGVAISLAGEVLLERERIVTDPSLSPLGYVEELLAALYRDAPPPFSVALAVNSADSHKMSSSISEKYGVPCHLAGNVQAMAYKCLWEEGTAPLAVLGVGNRIKCAFLEEECRVADVGVLSCPVAFSREGNQYERFLSAAEVEGRLRESRYSDLYAAEGARLYACEEIGDYSRLLARTLASLLDTVQTFSAPKALYVFGDYLTEGFFERVRSESRYPNSLQRLKADRSSFAVGTALFALRKLLDLPYKTASA